jgi:SAM-dependent methyltransferase
MNSEAYVQMFECEQSHWWYQGMEAIMASLLERHFTFAKERVRVLDVGCGTGGKLQRLSACSEATGIDVALEALKFCRQRDLPRLCQGTVEALPFHKNTFDLITCYDVLYHRQVINDQKAIAEMAEILKPGGHLLVREPAYNFLKGSSHDEAVHTSRRYNAQGLRSQLECAGLCIKRITYANTILFPVAVARRLCDRLWRRQNASSGDPDLAVHAWKGLLLGMLQFEAILIKRLNFPFGLSLLILARK